MGSVSHEAPETRSLFVCDSGDDWVPFPCLARAARRAVLWSAAFSKQSLLGEAGKRGRVNVQREATGTALPLQQSCGQKPNILK